MMVHATPPGLPRSMVAGPDVSDLLAAFEETDAILQESQVSARRASVLLEELVTSEHTLPPETRTYISVIVAQSRLADGSARTASRILRLLREHHPEVFQSPIVLNAVLDCHAKCSDGSAMECIDLLVETNRAAHAIDIVTYNTVMNVLSKCADGSAVRAYSILLEMKARGIQPNLVSYNTVIDAQARRPDGSARTALAVLQQMMEDHSRELFPDLSTFTSIINLQARKDDGSAASAFRVLDSMRHAGIPPNTIILNSVIDTQAKQRDGQARVALLVLEAMKKAPADQDVQPNVVTYTSVIDCCAKCRDGEGRIAVKMLEEMVSANLVPNHMTYGTVINAQAKRGSARMASAILKKMIATEAGATQVAYNSVLNSHAKCEDGSAMEALLILESMKAAGIQPNTITYSSCIDAQAKKRDGSAETAAQLLEESLHMGLRPDTVTFTCVLDAQAKRDDGSAEKAAAILDRMLDLGFVRPNQIHFNSAINACANSRPADIWAAERILNRAMIANLSPNNYTLSALLRCAAFANPPQPDLACQWFQQYGHSVEINEHIERALGNAVGELAHDLLRSVGHVPTQPVRRASQRSNSRRTSRVDGPGPGSSGGGSASRRSSAQNWRGGGSGGDQPPASPTMSSGASPFPWNSTTAADTGNQYPGPSRADTGNQYPSPSRTDSSPSTGNQYPGGGGGWRSSSPDTREQSGGHSERSIPKSRNSWRTEARESRASMDMQTSRSSMGNVVEMPDLSSMSFGTPTGNQYPGPSTGNLYPGPSSSGRRTDSGSRKQPAPLVLTGNQLILTGNQYPGSPTGNQYPGSPTGNQYPGGSPTTTQFAGNGYQGSRSSQGSSLAQASHTTGLLATPTGPPGGGGGLLATPMSPTLLISPTGLLPSSWASFGVEPSNQQQQQQPQQSSPRPALDAGSLRPPAGDDRQLPASWAAVGRERDNRRRSGVQGLVLNADDSLFEARRLSLGGDGPGNPRGQSSSPVVSARRSSLAGVHATQAATEPRLSTETIADLTSALGAGSRRLSLSEKIQKIKAENGNTGSPLGQGTVLPNWSPRSHRASSPQVESSMLLGPDFFTKGMQQPSKSPPGLRRGSVPANVIQNIIRMPVGPDGSRGFGAARRASMASATTSAY